MKKAFTLLTLLLCSVCGLAVSAQTTHYKPGARKASLAADDVVFIYNTCFNGSEDRTGFIYNAGSSINVQKEKPYSDAANYHYENIMKLKGLYEARPELKNPAVIIDSNHSNSHKDPFQQPRIIKEVLSYCTYNAELKGLIKGFMVESYIEDGNQKPGGGVYGKSITDACLGWEKSERLVLDIADML